MAVRLGKTQKGRFDVESGMAFRMHDLKDILSEDEKCKADKHPWLITKVYDNYVEIVMCTTLTENSENKHRLYELNHDNLEDIPNPCPPMDPNSQRQQAFCKDKFRILPKKELFSHKLQILNQNNPYRNFETEDRKSLCLDEEMLKFIRKQCLAYSSNLSDMEMDPFGVLEAEYKLADIPEGTKELAKAQKEFNKKYGWSYLKQADTRAVYPFEDQMNPYEENDKVLLATVQERDKPRLSQKDLDNINIQSPDLKK